MGISSMRAYKFCELLARVGHPGVFSVLDDARRRRTANRHVAEEVATATVAASQRVAVELLIQLRDHAIHDGSEEAVGVIDRFAATHGLSP